VSSSGVLRQAYYETMEIQGFTGHVLAALRGEVPQNVNQVSESPVADEDLLCVCIAMDVYHGTSSCSIDAKRKR
jgi:hypothetical protein